MTAGYDPHSPEPGRGGPPARPASAEPAGPDPGFGSDDRWSVSSAPPYGPPPAYSDPTGVGRPVGPAYAPGPLSGGGGFPAPLGAPYGAPRPAGSRGVLGWLGVVALVMAVALGVVAVLQAGQIGRLDDALSRADQREAEAQAGDAKRLEELESRTEALATEAGKAFNPEAVAAAALPSVFRVEAGDFTGTAFAVGEPAANGGSNMFTNYHVVQQVWDRGDRQVAIKRRDQRYDATIVRVDKENDVAHLTTTGKFTGLEAAAEPVKSGQQIVVVGAPLGLEDTVTTGVVSASRKLPGTSTTVIQFSAPINPGNSGGPVINSRKQVVGIATAKAERAEGIGLAVPIKTACDLFNIC